MTRIARAFARRFRELLTQLGARDRDKGIALLFEQAHRLQKSEPLDLPRALARVNIHLAAQVHRFARRSRQSPPEVPRIVCDAGLGGLARWLRAAGCEAFWTQDIGDAELVRQAETLQALIITTDSFLLDRRPIVQARVKALWVPPTLTKLEQLELVRAELDLPETDSRCMTCGGELEAVPKEQYRHSIPPRTYQWVDEYFRCSRCSKLFWQGTHWNRISDRLKNTSA